MPLTVKENALNIPREELTDGLAWAAILHNGDLEHPMKCGVWTLQSGGKPYVIDYPSTAFALVVEGELELEDLTTSDGPKKLVAGDVVRIDKGAELKMSTTTSAKVYHVIQGHEKMTPHSYVRGT